MDRGYLVPAGEEGSLPFPTTIEQLKAGGYVFQEHKPCSGKTCNAQIEFWKTPKEIEFFRDLQLAVSSILERLQQ